MLRIENSPELVEQAAGVIEQARGGALTIVRPSPTIDAERLVPAIVAAAPCPVVVLRIPAALDQVPEASLALLDALYPDAGAAQGEQLRDALASASRYEAWLATLEAALEGRWLAVEHLDRLAPRRADSLGDALGERAQRLWRFCLDRAVVVTGRAPVVERRERRAVPLRPASAPGVRLMNGAPRAASVSWEDVGDSATYRLALALQALGARTVEPIEATALRERIWDLVAESVRTVLRWLAVHGRPIARSLVERWPDVSSEGIERGLSLGLWSERAGALALDDGWVEWYDRAAPATRVRELHRQLAASMIAREDRAPSPTETHQLFRHLLASGDADQAWSRSMYGVELLVEHARALSESRQFEQAATLYQRLLDREALDGRLRAYALHYLHFNRAHARPELESVAQTAAGYREATEGWPDNALFWSRAIRASVLADERDAARSAMRRAAEVVPPHDDRGARLYARTARRLVDLQRPMDAIELLGDYRPDSERAWEDFNAMCAKLAAGWMVSSLAVREQPALQLDAPARATLCWQSKPWSWSFTVGELPAAVGDAPMQAIERFIRAQRARASATPTAFEWPWLTPEEAAERNAWWASIAANDRSERARALIARLAQLRAREPSGATQRALAEWLDWLRALLLSGDAPTIDALFVALDDPDALPRAAATLLLSMTRESASAFAARDAFAARVERWLRERDGLSESKARQAVMAAQR